ncbi:hypothetical protein ACRAWF_20125 [Streptomyces sp. L7]
MIRDTAADIKGKLRAAARAEQKYRELSSRRVDESPVASTDRRTDHPAAGPLPVVRPDGARVPFQAVGTGLPLLPHRVITAGEQAFLSWRRGATPFRCSAGRRPPDHVSVHLHGAGPHRT